MFLHCYKDCPKIKGSGIDLIKYSYIQKGRNTWELGRLKAAANWMFRPTSFRSVFSSVPFRNDRNFGNVTENGSYVPPLVKTPFYKPKPEVPETVATMSIALASML